MKYEKKKKRFERTASFCDELIEHWRMSENWILL